ncbi:MAG: M48 family metallopeptidase [Clostridia bacterium]|nr:M48 family metallopeptidase [Clostridia bacterium]
MKYDVELVFSKRKSLSITVSAENKITLRCPLGYSRERAERFLNDKSAWIEKTVLRNEKKLSFNADIISYKSIFVNGAKLPLFVDCKKAAITGEGVFVKSIKDIKKLFVSSFAKAFVLRVEEVASRTGLKFNGIAIKSYKSRWGCCDGGNNLAFNYKLFMLPDRIQYYIIVHELCHTAQHNHSEKFWRLVEKFVPDYKKIKKDLRGYDFLTTLY